MNSNIVIFSGWELIKNARFHLYHLSQKQLRMKKLFLAGLFCAIFTLGFAQTHSFTHVCGGHVHGDAESDMQLKTVMLQFSSQSEAKAVLNDIMSYVGLRANFKIEPADVPNAAAVITDHTRYILYNPSFINSVKRGTKTNWSAVSILAHEIGHHLNGHTVLTKGNWHKMELESDEFSGFVLRKMGASLKDAQAAMNLLASPTGSRTHPGKNDRLAAIQRGWDQADEMMGGYEDSEPVTVNEKPKKKKEKPRREQYPGQDIYEAEEDFEEDTYEEDVYADEVIEEEPEPVFEEPVVHPSFAKWKVTLVRNPNSSYYITKGNKFVVMKGEKIFPIGKFTRNKNDKYPFLIKFEGSPDLLVTPNGELVNKNGNNVGFILKV
jgi:hypothetical protein